MREPDSSPTGIVTLSTEGIDVFMETTTSMDYMHKYDRAVSMSELEQNLNVGTTPTRGGPNANASGAGAPQTPMVMDGQRSRSEGITRPMTPGHQRPKQWRRPRPTPWARGPNMNDCDKASPTLTAEKETNAEAEAELDLDAEEMRARPNNYNEDPDGPAILNSEAENWAAIGGSLGHSSSLICAEATPEQTLDTQATLPPCGNTIRTTYRTAPHAESQDFESQATRPPTRANCRPLPDVDGRLSDDDCSRYRQPHVEEVKLENSPTTCMPGDGTAPLHAASPQVAAMYTDTLDSQSTSAGLPQDPDSGAQGMPSTSARSLWASMTSSVPAALDTLADDATRSQMIETQPSAERDTAGQLIEGEAQSEEANDVADPSNSISKASEVRSREDEGARSGPAVVEEGEERRASTINDKEEKEAGSWSVDYLVGAGVPRIDRQLYEDEHESAADEIEAQIAALQQEYQETTARLTVWLRRGREVQAERDTCRLYSALNAVQAEEGQLDEKHAKIREFSTRIQAAMAAFGGMTGGLF